MKKKSNIRTFLGGPAPGPRIAVSLLLLGAQLVAHPHFPKPARPVQGGQRTLVPSPPEGDGKGIVVRIEMPWKVLLQGERITFNYILENHSEHAIPVAFPRGEPFGWPNGGQAFLEGLLKPGAPEPYTSRPDIRWLKVEEASWPPLDEEESFVEAWGELPAGRKIVWDRNRLRAEQNFRVYTTQDLRAIQGHWLVGKGRWVSSDPVAVEVRDVPKNQWIQVFEGEWSSYGRGLDKLIAKVTKVPLDGRWYLFSDFLTRICEVGENDDLRFGLNSVIGQLEVTVTTATCVKKHYYHLMQGVTRDFPWKEGPISQYWPVPEPIPASDLAMLHDSNFKDARAVGNNIPIIAAPMHSGTWIYCLAGVLVIVVISVLGWRKLKRSKA